MIKSTWTLLNPRPFLIVAGATSGFLWLTGCSFGDEPPPPSPTTISSTQLLLESWASAAGEEGLTPDALRCDHAGRPSLTATASGQAVWRWDGTLTSAEYINVDPQDDSEVIVPDGSRVDYARMESSSRIVYVGVFEDQVGPCIAGVASEEYFDLRIKNPGLPTVTPSP
jgi:hypothetical protein